MYTTGRICKFVDSFIRTIQLNVHSSRIFVRLGDHGASDLEPHDYYIENVKVHDNYSADSRGPANDIAIIRISGYVIYTSNWIIIFRYKFLTFW